MQKTLVLIDDLYKQYNLSMDETNDIRFMPMLKGSLNNRLLRAMRKIHLSSCLPLKKIWLEKWIRLYKEYDTIILADAGNTFNVVKYIRGKNFDKRLIVWYRNSVCATIHPNQIDRKLCELWSFDKEDCQKYFMQYNPQFYIKNQQYKEHTYQYDAFFVGQDKGRLDNLLELEKLMKDKGYHTKFCIVGFNSEKLTYKQILDYIGSSRVIVDYQCDWQEGITLRPLEALFYHKKLITNNEKIMETDFYNPSNVFILNKDQVNCLSDFYASEYKNLGEEILNKYDLPGWVARFYE